MTPDLFPQPAHELLIERRALEFQAELHAMAARARVAVDEAFQQALARSNRSIAQRKRFHRIRQLLGVKQA